MLWVYIIIGLVVVIGLLYWVKSRKKEEGVDLSATSPTPPETPQPTETEETPPSDSDEEKPM